MSPRKVRPPMSPRKVRPQRRGSTQVDVVEVRTILVGLDVGQ